MPRTMSPARLNLDTISASLSGTKSLSDLLPLLKGTPAQAWRRSLRRKGTPLKAPSGRAPFAVARACANIVVITAFRCGLSCSIRLIASSQSSEALTCPSRTSPARPMPSYWSYSLNPAMISSFYFRFFETPVLRLLPVIGFSYESRMPLTDLLVLSMAHCVV